MNSISLNIPALDGSQVVFQAATPQKLIGISLVNAANSTAIVNLYKQVSSSLAIHILPKDLELSGYGQLIRSGDYVFLNTGHRLSIATSQPLSMDLTFESI